MFCQNHPPCQCSAEERKVQKNECTGDQGDLSGVIAGKSSQNKHSSGSCAEDALGKSDYQVPALGHGTAKHNLLYKLCGKILCSEENFEQPQTGRMRICFGYRNLDTRVWL